MRARTSQLRESRLAKERMQKVYNDKTNDLLEALQKLRFLLGGNRRRECEVCGKMIGIKQDGNLFKHDCRRSNPS